MKTKIIILICACIGMATITKAQGKKKLSDIPVASGIYTNSSFIGVDDSSGYKIDKRYTSAQLSSFIAAVTPSGDTAFGPTAAIQTKSSTGGFAGVPQFTYDGAVFRVGFPSSTNHFTVSTGGQCLISLTDLMAMSSTTGNIYFQADANTQLYSFGYPASSRIVIDAALAHDTLPGEIYLPGLGGSGSGVVAVDNYGHLSWSAGAGGGGFTVVASNDLIHQTGSLPAFTAYNASNSIYSVGGYITVNSTAGGSVTMRVSYTNENGAAVTNKTLFPTGQTSAAISTTGSFYIPDIQFRASPGVITISFNASGTIDYNPGATITYIRP